MSKLRMLELRCANCGGTAMLRLAKYAHWTAEAAAAGWKTANGKEYCHACDAPEGSRKVPTSVAHWRAVKARAMQSGNTAKAKEADKNLHTAKLLAALETIRAQLEGRPIPPEVLDALGGIQKAGLR